jgi:hypothetical protein
MDDLFLAGVDGDHVRRRLAAAGGTEIASGKLASPESSAALAVNAFGRFIVKPGHLPPLPGTNEMGVAEVVDVEFCARFPWSGGRHPWLDAVVITGTHLIGVECKRFEPFRDKKVVSLSAAYDRPVWGDHMTRFCDMRDRLRTGARTFKYLDAAQLVKHAFGLVTEGRRRDQQPVVFYLFAEPAHRADRPIPTHDHQLHRAEIAAFASAVAGDEVTFLYASYREWFMAWGSDPDTANHALALSESFSP